MDKVTIEQVRDFIFHVEDPAILRTLSSVIQDQHRRVGAKRAFTFEKGDRVFFIKGKRSPRRITGEVVMADARWVYIKADGHPVGAYGWNWKVGPTLLQKETKEFGGTGKVRV